MSAISGTSGYINQLSITHELNDTYELILKETKTKYSKYNHSWERGFQDVEPIGEDSLGTLFCIVKNGEEMLTFTNENFAKEVYQGIKQHAMLFEKNYHDPRTIAGEVITDILVDYIPEEDMESVIRRVREKGINLKDMKYE